MDRRNELLIIACLDKMSTILDDTNKTMMAHSKQIKHQKRVGTRNTLIGVLGLVYTFKMATEVLKQNEQIKELKEEVEKLKNQKGE